MHCQRIVIVLFCLWALFECCLAVRWADFEDFLMNHNPEAGSPESTTPPPSDEFQFGASGEEDFGSGGGEDGNFLVGDSRNFRMTTTTTQAPTTLPRSRMTCCELGKLAGQNNFHCNPSNYGPQMSDRNPNRAYGNFKRTQPSNRHAFTQVKQFSKCISRQVRQLAMEFQVCCKQAYREQLHQARENEMILEVPVAVNANNKPSRTIFHTERDNTNSHKIPAILGVELAEDSQHEQERDNRRYGTRSNRGYGKENTRW